MWACRVSPVSGSNTATVSPAKSTNSFSPGACVCASSPTRSGATRRRGRKTDCSQPGGAVLQPEQHQRHATALELFMQARPIQWRTLWFLLERGGREQPPFQLGVVDLLRHRPGDADHLGPANVLPDRR